MENSSIPLQGSSDFSKKTSDFSSKSSKHLKKLEQYENFEQIEKIKEKEQTEQIKEIEQTEQTEQIKKIEQVEKNEEIEQINNMTNEKDKINPNDYTCNYCFSTFTRKDNFKRHLNNCKVKKLEDEKKENIFNSLLEKERINELYNMFNDLSNKNEELKKNNEDLNKKNEELNKKIDEIVKKNTHSITNNTQNITNNNTQNITNINITPFKINPFGKETFDKLNKKDILKIMTDTRNNGKHCFNKLIDLIHFNNNVPENQNIYMSDFNRGKFMINDGKDWNISQNEEFVLFEILEHVRRLYFDIEDDEFEEKFENDKNFRTNFNTTFKKYYDYLYDEVEDHELNDEEFKKKYNFKNMMNTEVKNKLYNKRNYVIQNQEKFKQVLNQKQLEAKQLEIE